MEPQGGRALLTMDTPESRRKAQLDALLLPLPGVSARTINKLDAYFVTDKMFACISGDGVGLRLPVAAATDCTFRVATSFRFSPGVWQVRANGYR